MKWFAFESLDCAYNAFAMIALNISIDFKIKWSDCYDEIRNICAITLENKGKGKMFIISFLHLTISNRKSEYPFVVKLKFILSTF